MFRVRWKKTKRDVGSFTRYVIGIFLRKMFSMEAISQCRLEQVRVQVTSSRLSHLTGLKLDIRDDPLGQILHFLAVVLLNVREHLRVIELFIRRHQ